MNPPETVVEAMPGTAAELAEKTGYPLGQVYRLIHRARLDGHRITATMHTRSDDGTATTVFEKEPNAS